MEADSVYHWGWMVKRLAVMVALLLTLTTASVYADSPTVQAPMLAATGTASGGGYSVDYGYWRAVESGEDIDLPSGATARLEHAATWGDLMITLTSFGQSVLLIWGALFLGKRLRFL